MGLSRQARGAEVQVLELVLVWEKLKQWSGAVWPCGARCDLREGPQVGSQTYTWINTPVL